MKATTTYEYSVSDSSSYCWTGFSGTQIWLTLTEEDADQVDHEVFSRIQVPKEVAVKMAQRILEQVTKEENELLQKGELAMEDAILGDPEEHPDCPHLTIKD